MLSDEYPKKVICEVLGCARSSYYYDGASAEDQKLREVIQDVIALFPRYGYRRVTKQLQREGLVANHKRVARLMHEMGLQQKVKRRQCRTTNSDHQYPRYHNLVRDLEIIHPDQVWVCDITYIRLRSEFIYLTVIMDVFTRCIRGWNLGRSLDQELTITALKRALEKGIPEIHHSDQGVQYAAIAYTELLRKHGVKISMSEVGQAHENGYAERLIRTVKEEEVDLSDYEDYEDALRQIGRFLEDVYMHKRIHSSLGYLTPSEFEEQWKRQQGAVITKNSLKCVQKMGVTTVRHVPTLDPIGLALYFILCKRGKTSSNNLSVAILPTPFFLVQTI